MNTQQESPSEPNNLTKLLSRLKELLKTQFLLVLATVFIMFFVHYRPEFGDSISWKSSEEVNSLTLITTLSFIALALQSTLEIFIGNFREPKKFQDDSNVSIADYRQQTKELANIVGLCGGLVIALSGVRVIQPFIGEFNLESWQRELFHAADILLTASLLSGGSDGIHQLTKVYQNSAEKLNELLSKKPRE